MATQEERKKNLDRIETTLRQFVHESKEGKWNGYLIQNMFSELIGVVRDMNEEIHKPVPVQSNNNSFSLPSKNPYCGGCGELNCNSWGYG